MEAATCSRQWKSGPCYSKFGPWTSSRSLPWELVRNVEEPQNPWGQLKQDLYFKKVPGIHTVVNWREATIHNTRGLTLNYNYLEFELSNKPPSTKDGHV